MKQTFPDKPIAALETLLKGTGKAITYTGATTPRLQIVLTEPPRTGMITDFNCDGVEDTVIGDPRASVGGDAEAGLVRVVYGGGKGTAELHQDLAAVPGDAEPGDMYGEKLATFDHDQDGCTDLVVGTPGEDIDSSPDAGSVQVLHGAPGGLGTGPAALNLIQGTGEGAIKATTPEAGDRFGAAIAAGHTAQGEPYLVIGAPGEDLGTVVDAGVAYYLRGNVNVAINQNTPGTQGPAEEGDLFGASLAGSAHHIVIGAPGEAVGTLKNAGSVQVFQHGLNSSGIPAPIAGLHQDGKAVSGAAEAGDQFGAAVAAVAYMPTGATSATDTIMAVGSPGEALTVGTTDVTEAGTVQAFRITSAGQVSQVSSINAEVTNVDGSAAAGDRFGQSLVLTNLDAGTSGSAQTLNLAIGIPGKDIGAISGAGAVQTFYPFDAPGATDSWLQAGDASGLGGTPTAGHAVGENLAGTATRLYVGVPKTAQYGAAYALPWGNVTAGRSGTTGTATAFRPGQGGLPAAGGAFGSAMG
ncbi:esterase [Streptomyces sp. NPDC088923]|uniref:esterase n=1 Tax=Streptomyces sp. NPDC088923 TaxID=3365913 RepID=UPI003819D3B2